MAGKTICVFVSGATTRGTLYHQFEPADLNNFMDESSQYPTWRHCIDSLSVTLAADTDAHVTVATSHSGRSNHLRRDNLSFSDHTPVAVFTLKGSAGEKVGCVSSGAKMWVGEPVFPHGGVDFHFRNADTGEIVDFDAVHAVVLFNRVT